ncbi:hypothetical protein DRO27_05305 [Candidatus Bathyarchaeota archaeon]|nr:MAG: hypothetical protein DRO27_05305 [Candidatus Bathyarchaeota archaeon]
MLKLTGDEVVEMHGDWKGNGGKLSLHEMTKKYKMKCNDVYAVLSAVLTKQTLGVRRRIGLNVHAYDPAYGTRDKEKKS